MSASDIANGSEITRGVAEQQPLLSIEELRTWFPIRHGLLRRIHGHVKAVDNVSMMLHEGETVGLVGESGCGKTTLVQTLLRLIPATGGNVYIHRNGDRRNVLGFDKTELKKFRRRIQMVFQDPSSSLSPRMTVGEIIAEPLRVHRMLRGRALDNRIDELLDAVGLSPSMRIRLTRSFSGGQKQRIGIARALALDPDILVLDEPVSALDVSVQSQILNLLKELKQRRGLTYLFIAHNLDVVRYMSDRVAVMYLGKIVEEATAAQLYSRPLHPYTESLLQAIPTPVVRKKERYAMPEGDLPDPANPPSGCSFHPRCPFAKERCRGEIPELRRVGGDRRVACHFAEDLQLGGRSA